MQQISSLPGRLVLVAAGTDVGKTHVAARLLAHNPAQVYWKPVQAGQPADADTIKDYLLFEGFAETEKDALARILPSVHIYKNALSPHECARLEGVTLTARDIQQKLPENELLIVETAGGLFSPLNERQTMAHLVLALGLPVFLVARDYLGCITHIMATVLAARTEAVAISGIIVSGEMRAATREFLEAQTGLPFYYLP